MTAVTPAAAPLLYNDFMRLRDTTTLALGALRHYRLRTFLTMLGIAVGIAAVVLLTAIGEGINRFVMTEFTQFGTHLLSISPGKTTTHGMPGAIIGNVRPLSLEDATALRRLPQVVETVPVVQGNAAVEFGSHSRRVMVFGGNHAVPQVWQFKLALGQFLPNEDVGSSRALVVLGAKVRHELFAQTNPLGQYVRIGGYRYQVIGVMEAKGQLLGFDLDDAVYLPTPQAMSIFNRDSLMEIDLLYSPSANADTVAKRVKELLIARHGSEDFTIITQAQMLDTLGNILNILTLAVAAIGAISLLVGGIGITTIMTIAVSERTSEVGLLRALGAERQQILILFLGEAVTLGALGGLGGLILGVGMAELLHGVIPALPVHLSPFYIALAESVAITIGLVAGLVPARQAARLDPVEALRAE